ncbi:hypothetical protein DFH09DRAFT_1334212 [Mycena vulgaris]|nr:hypothetical protein DFH09DRAFT_1334212 [Mycena vulgaris]
MMPMRPATVSAVVNALPPRRHWVTCALLVLHNLCNRPPSPSVARPRRMHIPIAPTFSPSVSRRSVLQCGFTRQRHALQGLVRATRASVPPSDVRNCVSPPTLGADAQSACCMTLPHPGARPRSRRATRARWTKAKITARSGFLLPGLLATRGELAISLVSVTAVFTS